MGIGLATVALPGASAISIIIFEVTLNATSIFNHGNVRLPDQIDQRLCLLLVTPGMHRVHHFIVRRETDSNVSLSVPWWDGLFSTCISQPTGEHTGMVIGIEQFRNPNELRLERLLIQPFKDF